METPRLLLVCALVALVLPRVGAGQDPAAGQDPDRGVIIVGTIVDQTTGNALENASISVRPANPEAGESWGGTSDSDGEFDSRRLGMGTYDISVQMLGFTEVEHRATFTEDGLVDLRIEMVPAPFRLDPVVVTAVRLSRLETQGFFERRKVGLGHTFTRAEIEKRGPSRVTDLFQGIPGVRVLPGRPGRAADIRLRGNCMPQLVVDGMPLSLPAPIDELLTVAQLEAVEVYHGATSPVQFAGSACGTVMAWTRDGSGSDGSPFSWRRLFIGAGLATLLAIISTR